MKKYFITFILILTIIYSCEKDTAIIGPSPSGKFTYNEEKAKKVLFYALSINDINDQVIYVIDEDGLNLDLLVQGRVCYPTWIEDKQKIAYQDLDNYSVMIKDIDNPSHVDSLLCSYNKNVMFMKYSNVLDMYLFSYWENGISQIALLDNEDFNLRSERISVYDERNPVTSYTDEWIYFCTNINGTFDIYKMTESSQNYQEVFSDGINNFNTFSVSYDGSLLVSPRYLDQVGDIIVYDLQNRKILHEINPSLEEGIPLYTALSIDNKYILFINGIPNDYTKPRKITSVILCKNDLII